MRRSERIAKELHEGVALPAIVFAKQLKVKNVWPLYVGAMLEHKFLILTDGSQEFFLPIKDNLLEQINRTDGLNVENAPRHPATPSRVVMSLAKRRLVGRKWLNDV